MLNLFCNYRSSARIKIKTIENINFLKTIFGICNKKLWN